LLIKITSAPNFYEHQLPLYKPVRHVIFTSCPSFANRTERYSCISTRRLPQSHRPAWSIFVRVSENIQSHSILDVVRL
jgi:hypothetical protein